MDEKIDILAVWMVCIMPAFVVSILWLSTTDHIPGVLYRAFFEIVFNKEFAVNRGVRSANRILRRSKMTGEETMTGFYRHSKESVVPPEDRYENGGIIHNWKDKGDK